MHLDIKRFQNDPVVRRDVPAALGLIAIVLPLLLPPSSVRTSSPPLEKGKHTSSHSSRASRDTPLQLRQHPRLPVYEAEEREDGDSEERTSALSCIPVPGMSFLHLLVKECLLECVESTSTPRPYCVGRPSGVAISCCSPVTLDLTNVSFFRQLSSKSCILMFYFCLEPACSPCVRVGSVSGHFTAQRCAFVCD